MPGRGRKARTRAKRGPTERAARKRAPEGAPYPKGRAARWIFPLARRSFKLLKLLSAGSIGSYNHIGRLSRKLNTSDRKRLQFPRGCGRNLSSGCANKSWLHGQDRMVRCAI
jgi:hypothetical protein